MSEIVLTRMRSAAGVWEGLLSTKANSAPRLLVRHEDTVVSEPESVETGEKNGSSRSWLVRFRLPVDCLSDGIQTFVIEDADTGDALPHECHHRSTR